MCTFSRPGRLKYIAGATLAGLIVFAGQIQFCQAEEIRIARPEAPEHNCCGSTENNELNSNSSAIRWPGSIVDFHHHWQLRYVQPVFCPMVTCMSTCGNYADACVLDSTAVVLDKKYGCAGACK